jgi:hypothetical protein
MGSILRAVGGDRQQASDMILYLKLVNELIQSEAKNVGVRFEEKRTGKIDSKELAFHLVEMFHSTKQIATECKRLETLFGKLKQFDPIRESLRALKIEVQKCILLLANADEETKSKIKLIPEELPHDVIDRIQEPNFAQLITPTANNNSVEDDLPQLIEQVEINEHLIEETNQNEESKQ